MIAAGHHRPIHTGQCDVHGAQWQIRGAVLVGESQPQARATLGDPHHLPYGDVAEVGAGEIHRHIARIVDGRQCGRARRGGG